MKKIGIILIIIISIFLTTACGNKNEANKMNTIQYDGEYLGTLELSYPRNVGFSIKEDTNERGKTMEFYSYDHPIIFLIQLDMMNKDEYQKQIKKELKNDYAKEYTWNGYKGVALLEEDQGAFRVLLKEENDAAIYINGQIRRNQDYSNTASIKDMFNKKAIQDLLNSMKYEKK